MFFFSATPYQVLHRIRSVNPFHLHLSSFNFYDFTPLEPNYTRSDFVNKYNCLQICHLFFPERTSNGVYFFNSQKPRPAKIGNRARDQG